MRAYKIFLEIIVAKINTSIRKYRQDGRIISFISIENSFIDNPKNPHPPFDILKYNSGSHKERKLHHGFWAEFRASLKDVGASTQVRRQSYGLKRGNFRSYMKKSWATIFRPKIEV